MKNNTKSETRRDVTHRRIKMAILAIIKGRANNIALDRKLSIKAVAEEAQVSPALIHNKYPELADDIRARLATTALKKQKVAQDHSKLTATRNKELRQEITTLKEELRKLASINANLTLKNEEYLARLNSKSVLPFPSKQTP